MAERIFYPAPWQVRAALEGRLKLVYVPMQKQPAEGVTYRGYYADEDTHLWTASYSLIDNWPMAKAPFAPGDTLLGKEAWSCRTDIADEDIERLRHYLLYRADTTDHAFAMARHPYSKWRSPVHMPHWAVRIKFTVKAVSAVRVRKVTEEDCRLTGADEYHPFQESFERRYWRRYPWNTAWGWRVEMEQCEQR